MHNSCGFTSYQSKPAYKPINFGQNVEFENCILGKTHEYFNMCSNIIFSKWIPKENLTDIIITIITNQIQSIRSNLDFIKSTINEDYDYYSNMIHYYDFESNTTDKANTSKNIDFILLYYLFIRENKDNINYLNNIYSNKTEIDNLFNAFIINEKQKYPYWINLNRIENRIKSFKSKSKEELIKSFRDIESKLKNLYQDSGEAASELDNYIQHLIDIYKGK